MRRESRQAAHSVFYSGMSEVGVEKAPASDCLSSGSGRAHRVRRALRLLETSRSSRFFGRVVVTPPRVLALAELVNLLRGASDAVSCCAVIDDKRIWHKIGRLQVGRVTAA